MRLPVCTDLQFLYVVDYFWEEYGRGPTVAELGEILGYKGKNSWPIDSKIRDMKDKRLVRRVNGQLVTSAFEITSYLDR